MGVDETGHRERGLWSWCFHVPGKDCFTWFHIDPSRGSKVLKRYLGEAFDGIIGCDYFSAYRKFLRETNVWLQLCWAHLIRDVKYLATLVDRATCNYGRRLLDKIKALFRAWHRRGPTPTARWRRAIAKIRTEVLNVARGAPIRTEAQNMAKRFRDHGDAYFTFLDASGIEPTNNGPERQIRFLAIDRKITQGTRGEAGRRWCERIWTVLATCVQQGRSAFEFIYNSVIAQLHQPILPFPPAPASVTGYHAHQELHQIDSRPTCRKPRCSHCQPEYPETKHNQRNSHKQPALADETVGSVRRHRGDAELHGQREIARKIIMLSPEVPVSVRIHYIQQVVDQKESREPHNESAPPEYPRRHLFPAAIFPARLYWNPATRTRRPAALECRRC